MSQKISDRAKQLADRIDALYSNEDGMAFSELLEVIQSALDAERTLEGRIFEAWGRLCVDAMVRAIKDGVIGRATRDIITCEIRLAKGERSPELLAEIERLTEELQ
jgi:hypothetical protein